ncbi:MULTISPECIES: hypothetical protein [unclassified Streptomyces]|uniref:hypothetical protein n=1 Tax=unclassified Streptomyces TaxID=2593676 RepID=UPI000A5A18D3|nr:MULTISPECIES: hypothetical protein [unclassified Streptomyces]
MRTAGRTPEPERPRPGGGTPLGEAACRYQANDIPIEDVPMIAAVALAAGLDSPALRELAGLPRHADPRDVRVAFEQALAECGIALPAPDVARRHGLRRLAARFLAQDVALADLAADHWLDLEVRTAAERSFVALLPPCDCCTEYTLGLDRRAWEARLRSAALALASSPPVGPGC